MKISAKQELKLKTHVDEQNEKLKNKIDEAKKKYFKNRHFEMEEWKKSSTRSRTTNLAS